MPVKPARAATGLRILVRGRVQGVGFRPFVFRLARDLGLAGRVANRGGAVEVLARGPGKALEALVRALEREAPSLARVEGLTLEPLDPQGEEARDLADSPGFAILPSKTGDLALARVPPDTAACPECLAEMRDPADRRHAYPFLNCTACGPRYSIIRALPYDRAATTMADFAMCPDCAAEFADPANRRFHAQPACCPRCGPRLFLLLPGGERLDGVDPLDETARTLARGGIVAIRGMGGYHLAVDAASSQGVARLRGRKARPHRPLALMVPDLDTARRLCRVTPAAARALLSPARPIVLLERRGDAALAPELAPGLLELGLMLPAFPLHHLLLDHPACPRVLVMTSGNISGEPLCADNREAVEQLSSIADLLLCHDRPIASSLDDTVVQVRGGKALLLRRARGHVPEPLELGGPGPDLAALGADLKHACCVLRQGRAYLGQYVGALGRAGTNARMRAVLEHLLRLLEVRPRAVAVDLHPDYHSSRYGQALARERGLGLLRVQHHHAHAAAVVAEHRLRGPVLGLVMDGTGFGPDGTVWGGELLLVDGGTCRRLGRLEHLALPGGDRAAAEPWRSALGLFGPRAELACLEFEGVGSGEAAAVRGMLAAGCNSPLASSCGRLFDAVAALLTGRVRVSYEGQAAMELEALARRAKRGGRDPGPGWEVELRQEGDLLVLGHGPLRQALGGLPARPGREEAEALALAFHRWLAASLARAAARLARRNGLDTVVCSGGVMQNRLLSALLARDLEERGLRVFFGEQVPMNDGGIALGQAWVAAKRLRSGDLDAHGPPLFGERAAQAR